MKNKEAYKCFYYLLSPTLAQTGRNILRERPGSLEEIGTWYASDPGWAAKVAGCVKYIVKRSGENGR